MRNLVCALSQSQCDRLVIGMAAETSPLESQTIVHAMPGPITLCKYMHIRAYVLRMPSEMNGLIAHLGGIDVNEVYGWHSTSGACFGKRVAEN